MVAVAAVVMVVMVAVVVDKAQHGFEPQSFPTPVFYARSRNSTSGSRTGRTSAMDAGNGTVCPHRDSR